MNVKLGPISLTFATDVTRDGVDEAGAGRPQREGAGEAGPRRRAGRRSSRASATSPGGTRVDIVTDLTLSGAVAQYGRGIVQDVSGQLVARFADCLKAQLAAAAPEAEAEAAVAAVSRAGAGGETGLGPLARDRSVVEVGRTDVLQGTLRRQLEELRARGGSA